MARYYMSGRKIILPKEVFNEGEEGKLYLYKDLDEKEKLIKIFKTERRKNIPIPSEKMYLYQTTLKANRFYLARDLVYDEKGIFSGCMMNLFQNAGNLSYAQCTVLRKLLPEIKKLEEELDYLSEKHVHIGDIKVEHILYDFDRISIGVIDSGLYYYCDDLELNRDCGKEKTTLQIENYKELNYTLAVGLLWMNVLGDSLMMKSIDFPEIYDDAINGKLKLSEVLESESKKYHSQTILELKKQYQKQKMY